MLKNLLKQAFRGDTAQATPAPVVPASSGPASPQAMHDEAREFLTYQLSNTRVAEYPFPHFFVQPVFPQGYYALMRRHWPGDETLTPIHATGRVGGRDTSAPYLQRRVFELQGDVGTRMPAPIAAFWKGFAEWFTADSLREFIVSRMSSYLAERFGTDPWRVTSYADVVLTRDASQYQLGPHTDLPSRLATVIFYCPDDDSMADLGTTLYVPRERGFVCRGGPHYPEQQFIPVFSAPFVANSALGFLKTPRSFHGVRAIDRKGIRRDLIQYNLRVSSLAGGRDAFGAV